nr:hypothetical protein [Tanacetum cinerariifolium]
MVGGDTMKELTSKFGKLNKFEENNFRWWQKKMHFLSITLKVVYVMSTYISGLLEDNTLEAVRHTSNVDSANEFSDSLESKYIEDDASSKMFLISNFNNYKTVNSRPESLREQESEKVKGKEVVRPLINMMEDGANNKNNKQKKKRGFKDNNGGFGSNKKSQMACWKCGKYCHFKRDCCSGNKKEKQDKQKLYEITKASHACKQEDGRTMSSSFKFIICIDGKTIVELHAMLKLTEEGLPIKVNIPVVLAIRGGCGTHIRNTMQGLRTLKHGALNMCVGKRIEKLQHDEILQPADDESFDKCKSCISGKMARKPFPHQTRIAKELLGLIHTDVYLMKQKHEVFETFKAFQNEVEYQLGKKIKTFDLIEENTKPFENTSEQQDEVVNNKVEPHIKIVPIRRSNRIPQAPHRYGFYVDSNEHELGDLNEYPSYKSALSDPKSDKWVEAMNAKMQSLKDNQMRKLIDGLGSVVSTNKEPMKMLCDNTSAIAIVNNSKIMKGARHYQIKYHYIREVIEMGETVLNKVHTYDNIVDPFTTPMPLTKHNQHAMRITFRSASSLT